MLRIAVCDDEPICLENEKRIIENYLNGRNEKAIIDTFASTQELLVAASEIQYDLSMLDVEMPGINGMVGIYEICFRWLSCECFQIHIER